MEILGFILLAGVWAAFLLPRVFDSRRNAPITTTRNYARDTALLAAVSASATSPEFLARRRLMANRRRTLLALAGAAVTTLLIAIWSGSIIWLATSLAMDVALAAYITGLLYVKQQWAQQMGQVVQLNQQAIRPAPLRAADSTVRIVAG